MYRNTMRRVKLAALMVLLGTTPLAGKTVGEFTKLPLPRFVSMKADEGNVRRGPGRNHKIDWVFKHRYMPLQVVGEYEHWRRVVDIDGQGGWMHFRLLSGVRTVIVVSDKVALRRKPYDNAEPAAFAEQGVIARLGECVVEWCRVSVQKRKGWVRKSDIWGVEEGEIRD